MIEEYDDIEKVDDSLQIENSKELSQLQTEYLKELNIPSDVWNGMSKDSQTEQLGYIMARFNEIELPQELSKTNIVEQIYSPEIVEAYKQLEAPQDFIQIEQVSDVLADCEALKFDYWRELGLSEKEYILNDLEAKIAEIEHRPPCPIRVVDMPSNVFGGFNPDSKTIDINAAYIERSSYDTDMFREVLDTLVHEGRHAYQDYNVNVCEIHPRHSEVASWAETMEGGKWGYYGDTSTWLGQRLYEQQSIEIDARNFAADVLDKFEQKIA